ncbi:MAG TPA: carbon storage regulator [Bryobacteraceae bacterium]|jgi:carbon storage regulator|nr:carbon storage regulator [Bryobacteraceae bacterium]
MLIMARRQGETILIGDDIEIVIAHIGRSRVKVGIRAPREMTVVAQEVQMVGDENRAAAEAPSPAVLQSILAHLLPGAHTFSCPADEESVRQDAGAKN